MKEYESEYPDGAPTAVVHEAKVLLKMLEDIRDEGYTYAYNSFSAEFDCINRLRAFIVRNHDAPFALINYSLDQKPHYVESLLDLAEYLDTLESRMDGSGPVLPEVPALFADICKYTNSIFQEADSDTAFVFLLRDTLLPYLAFRKWDAGNQLALFPFLIGRRYLSLLHGQKDAGGESEPLYDVLHEAIFSALLKEPRDFSELRLYARELLQKGLKPFPEVSSAVSSLLSRIKQKKIIVVESGYIGSMPMLLSCFDDRVDFRLFTTIPCLYQAYKGKYYTNAFEKIRCFETIQCQDALFQLSSIVGDKFMISETDNLQIQKRASMELKTWNAIISQAG